MTKMRNLTVSDIYCLTSQEENETSPPKSTQEQLFSVKGNAFTHLQRRHEQQNSEVFPIGCMGNNKFVDVDAINSAAKKRERLSYDEQERAMNILVKIHRSRKALKLKLEAEDNKKETNLIANRMDKRSLECGNIQIVRCASAKQSKRLRSANRKLKLTVRKSQPNLTDFEYLIDLIKKGDNENFSQHGFGDGYMILSMDELKFMSALMMKQNSMAFFTSRLRDKSSPSRMCRNPITGNGMEENFRRERKRGFDSVLRFMEDSESNLPKQLSVII